LRRGLFNAPQTIACGLALRGRAHRNSLWRAAYNNKIGAPAPIFGRACQHCYSRHRPRQSTSRQKNKEIAMDLEPDFVFRPLPNVDRPQIRSLTLAAGSPLGPLQGLLGKWVGKGFNTIWRPNSTPGQDRFLELNLTDEILEFKEIKGEIPNRGLLQPDITMFGASYLQQIKDGNNKAGLHFEPGIWATVPKTENPAETPTVVRMASIPHGTTILAQGISLEVEGPPLIADNNITPFKIGDPSNLIPFPESNLSVPTNFRSPAADIVGITQAMVDNPNSVLKAAIAGQTFRKTVVLQVSSSPVAPVVGGGTDNTAFLQGAAAGPNAQAALVSAIFWIESVKGSSGHHDFDQLQYTQTVLLNFNGLSWPHITVATLRKK
jgi:hypothetical protein